MSEEHDWVRRLLAETGDSPEPMPAEVADRLDRVVADLSPLSGADDQTTTDRPDSGATTGPPRPGEVVPMTRSRHRTWGAALLAAAAVVVGGYTVTATGMLGDVTGADSESATASDAGGESSEESAAEGLAGGEEQAPPVQGDRLPTLSSDTLRRDAAALARASGADTAALRAQGDDTDTRDQRSATGRARCVPPPASLQGTRVRVTYDASPATAVVAPASGGRTVVQVWACDAPVRLARVLVPGESLGEPPMSPR